MVTCNIELYIIYIVDHKTMQDGSMKVKNVNDGKEIEENGDGR